MHLLQRLQRGAGYTMNDNRSAGGVKTEADIVCCSHCQRAMQLPDWKQDGGWCGKCNQHVCGPCADLMLTRGCEPFTRKIEALINRNYHAKQLARMLGI